jgi:DNA-3-methyladenine glycosylase II
MPERTDEAMDGKAPVAGTAAGLSDERLAAAVEELAARDADLAAIAERHGVPPLWDRPPGFATLLRIVFEQSVSLASARAVWLRVEGAAGGTVTPPAVTALGADELRRLGLSRAKAQTCLGLAAAVEGGDLDVDALAARDDDGVREALLPLRGIGPWTVDCYLLFALRRPDVWPAGDLALAKAAAEVKSLDAPPKAPALTALAEPWRPWRAVAARLLWFHYLGGVDPD